MSKEILSLSLSFRICLFIPCLLYSLFFWLLCYYDDGDYFLERRRKKKKSEGKEKWNLSYFARSDTSLFAEKETAT